MYSERARPRAPCKVQVVQQRSGSRQAPRGQCRATEFRGQPAAHPAVVRVHLAAQDYRRSQRERDARQLEPGQGEQMQPETDDRRADHRRDDMRHDRRDNQSPELRCAMRCVVVALLLEEEDGVRCLEGIDCPGARGFRQSVQVVKDGVVGLEAAPVLLPQLVCGGIDDYHGLAGRHGILHDICSSALAARGIAVPKRDQHVRANDRLDAAIEVGVLAVAVLVDDLQVVGGGQHFFRNRPLRGRKVGGKLRMR